MNKIEIYQMAERFMFLAPIERWIQINEIPGMILRNIMDFIISGSYKRPFKLNGKICYKYYLILENDDFTAFQIIPGKSRIEKEKENR